MTLLVIVWLFLVGLHWQNDGLWFQGDSARHAANGLFWKEFLLSGSLNPQDYALQYYARYPVISPINYPPLFYICEGTIFAVFHPSPYAAKSLVLFFALFAACYLMAWIRRWIAVGAGWAAALLLLLPGFVIWSSAVMLNVPATALSLAALYHARRWLESSTEQVTKRQLYMTAIFSVSAVLTYFLAGILILIILGWMLILRRWDYFFNLRTVRVLLVAAAASLPFLYVAIKWMPIHTGFITRGIKEANATSVWYFYLRELPGLTGVYILALSMLGLVLATIRRKWRLEAALQVASLTVTYSALSLISAKESRYALFLCVPIVCFCTIAMQSLAEWLSHLMKSRQQVSSVAALTVAAAMCGVQAWIAAGTKVPRVQGIKEVVAFMKRAAPNEPVFYDGFYSNVFTFYLQAGDPGYKRRVVLGGKLLYASAIDSDKRYRSYVSSPDDIVRTLQTSGGSRWLAIEQDEQSRRVPAAVLLRDTVQGPQFEFVRSFPLSGPGLDRIDIYIFKLNPWHIDESDIPFPILGNDVWFKVKPIQR